MNIIRLSGASPPRVVRPNLGSANAPSFFDERELGAICFSIAVCLIPSFIVVAGLFVYFTLIAQAVQD